MKIPGTDIELKESCLYCDDGKYRVYIYPTSNISQLTREDQENNHKVHDLGLRLIQFNKWTVLICDSCGNM